MRKAVLRFTGGHQRQIGVQAKAPTSSTTTQTDITLPQRVDVVWQSRMISPSAYVDSRAPDEDSDVEDSDYDDQTDNSFESAKDSRRTSVSHGPPIAALDALESHPGDSSDGSFFDFDGLDRVEVQEEMIANIESHNVELSPGGDIDSDGDVIPEADFSSTGAKYAQVYDSLEKDCARSSLLRRSWTVLEFSRDP